MSRQKEESLAHRDQVENQALPEELAKKDLKDRKVFKDSLDHMYLFRL